MSKNIHKNSDFITLFRLDDMCYNNNKTFVRRGYEITINNGDIYYVYMPYNELKEIL